MMRFTVLSLVPRPVLHPQHVDSYLTLFAPIRAFGVVPASASDCCVAEKD